jgi:hypothetical protein
LIAQSGHPVYLEFTLYASTVNNGALDYATTLGGFCRMNRSASWKITAFAGALAALVSLSASAQVTPASGYTPPDDNPSFKVGATIFADYTCVDSPTSKDTDGNTVPTPLRTIRFGTEASKSKETGQDEDHENRDGSGSRQSFSSRDWGPTARPIAV